ncbi:GTPase ObgE [Mariniplasma anaerobium]|uniref:GTPase Obg n=1 Tax=Mariniplasma anaerobium TaxID=2735436 RepID=A0A7U9THX9_9MOLU|nr:GTPase ObgE [Mariniplasma anaerobium]BCR36051.1 GTPase Obg [Mariniplasma anaerobium]
MFIDEVTVEVFGGRGGNGMASYRREKYVEYGGPWGGNGGHGGSIIFVGDEGKNNLIDLRYQRHIRAKNGENGMSKGMHGKNAEHRFIRVPLGTIVYSENKEFFLGEITNHDERLVVARGGKGGRGNIAFATAKNPAPDYAENGDPGEVRKLHIELKVIADVGLVGYPSVGKSTIISVVSNARPKIAEYHFTTLQPNLGMVYVGEESFVLADLPGLIEDAHIGHGLGIRFLKHIERCKVFLHVLDITRDDPYGDYVKINHELEMYDEALLERPQIVVINKIDMPDTKEKIEELKSKISHDIVLISAITQENVKTLMYKTLEALKEAPKIETKDEETHKLYEFEAQGPDFELEISEDNVFELSGTKLKIMFERTDFTKDEAVKRFARQLRSLGVDEALRDKGAKNGDIVRIFDFEFEFIE